MDVCCRTCRNVRTAAELGVVSPVTKADELFCGKRPPALNDVEPVSLPLCNGGRGYRNMACWKPDDGTVLFALTLKELEALHALFEWRNELLRAMPPGISAEAHRLDLGALVERVIGGLGYLRERGVTKGKS